MKTRTKSASFQILVVHGPNLNLLGEREPEIYGAMDLKTLNLELGQKARSLGVKLRCFQANGEGELIDYLHRHRKWADGLILNPGAYTHYSYALRDAVSAIQVPAVEVHLSDIRAREPFRKISVIKPVCLKQISGLGFQSYVQGLTFLTKYLEKYLAKYSARLPHGR